jgi:hypothetical protein
VALSPYNRVGYLSRGALSHSDAKAQVICFETLWKGRPTLERCGQYFFGIRFDAKRKTQGIVMPAKGHGMVVQNGVATCLQHGSEISRSQIWFVQVITICKRIVIVAQVIAGKENFFHARIKRND